MKGTFVNNNFNKDKSTEIQNKNLKSGYTNYILTLSKKTVRLVDRKNRIALFIFTFNNSIIANIIYYLIKFDNRKK
jgi:hypothetical protein